MKSAPVPPENCPDARGCAAPGPPSSFREAIDLLGGGSAVAALLGLRREHGGMLRMRDSIAPRWWARLAEAAAERELTGMTVADFALMYQRRWSKG